MSKQTVDELVEERLTEEATRVFDKALGDAEKQWSQTLS